MKCGYIGLGLFILPLLVSCAKDDAVSSDKKLESDIGHAFSKIDELTSDLTCDTNEQCKSIEYGHKPCGGPAGYKIYSTKNTDDILINEYADDYFQLTMKYNERHGLVSDCSFEIPPVLHCDIECKQL